MEKKQNIFSGKKIKKEYEIVKHDKYNIDDYRDIIDHFNTKLFEFMEEIYKICKENKWRAEADDLASYNEIIMLAVKPNKIVAIQHFINKIFPYWEFIKAKREDIFLNNEYKDIVENDMNAVEKIM